VALQRADHSSKEPYRLCKKDYESEEEARAKKRAVEPLMNEMNERKSVSRHKLEDVRREYVYRTSVRSGSSVATESLWDLFSNTQQYGVGYFSKR
jgi:hypothetical protein